MTNIQLELLHTVFRILGHWFEPQLSYLLSKSYYWMWTHNGIHTPNTRQDCLERKDPSLHYRRTFKNKEALTELQMWYCWGLFGFYKKDFT